MGSDFEIANISNIKFNNFTQQELEVFKKHKNGEIKGLSQALFRVRHRDKVLALKNKYHKENKEKEKSYYRLYTQNNRERINNKAREYRGTDNRIMRTDLRKRHNLTLEEFEKLKELQDNKCDICKNMFIKTPAVDHNHITGNIRGLLCSNCNTGIGLLKDSVEILTSAIGYLRDDTIIEI